MPNRIANSLVLSFLFRHFWQATIFRNLEQLPYYKELIALHIDYCFFVFLLCILAHRIKISVIYPGIENLILPMLSCPGSQVTS